MMLKPEMLWIDLETTGLRADSCVPLELGLTLTDKWGAQLGSWKTLIWESSFVDYKARTDNFVINMHTENGLWDDLGKFAVRTRLEAARQAVTWLESHGVEKFTLPMCGSSIGSLDRPFAIEHLHELHEFFHYRNIDVSTVRELCRLLNPTLLEKIEEDLADKYQVKHRVLEDIQDSITLYRALYENFLFLED
jgi:oligoribonuclease